MMQASEGPLDSQETRPVSLEAPFPNLPNFTVPPLEPHVASTIQFNPKVLYPGGYADVYQGSCILPGRNTREPVALKTFRLRGSTVSREEEMKRANRVQKVLAREVKLWQTINSRRTVPLYGYLQTSPFLTDSERPCVISAWRSNGSLERYLFDNPQVDRLPLLVQAAEAVNDLHTSPTPIVHLDIKPDNFLVNDENEVELCDFGLSRVLNGAPSGFTTSSGSGSRLFKAPEYMMDPTKYLTSLDVYAFGCFILAILSRKVPFHNLSEGAHMMAVMTGKRPEPKEYPIYLPPAVEDRIWKLMDRCWAHEPSSRPTMTEVTQELTQISLLNSNTKEQANSTS